MEKIELQAATRDVLGKKVRALRRQGITPTHLFGHGIESMSLQCDTAQLGRVLAQAGKTRIIDLKLEGAKKPRRVLVRKVQTNPSTSELLHVDFYEVRMSEAIRAEVPIVVVGESPALKFKENMLAHELNSLTVECLPDDIPNSVEIDISVLIEPEQAIRVKDIELGERIALLNDPEHIVVKVSALPAARVVEEEVEVPEEAPPTEEPAKEVDTSTS